MLRTNKRISLRAERHKGKRHTTVDGGDAANENGGKVEEDDRDGGLVSLSQAADILEDVVTVALNDIF